MGISEGEDMAPDRQYVDGSRETKRGCVVALQWLQRRLVAPSSEGLVVVPSMNQLDSGDFADLVGGNVKRDREFPLQVADGSTRTVRTEATRTLGFNKASAAVGLWLSPDALSKALES